jgi:NitT/TauT family transport system ATP-binding protein
MNQVRPQDTGASAPVSVNRIVVDKVSKTYGSSGTGTIALRDVSLTVEDQSFVSILGPSGCGKTTLLRMLNGLLQPDSGSVSVSGAPPQPGPDIGFVFQTFRLIPWESVRSNIEFALTSTGLSASEKRDRTEHYVDLVGLSKFADAFPSQLSGGMRQRVALARALVSEPEILLMDEPFASIDAQTRELMQIELMRIWNRSKPLVMFVTHSVDEAILLSDKIVLMGPRPGRILEVIDVTVPRPRWRDDVRALPEFIELRNYLWNRIRDLVLNDPLSDFYGRDLSAEA